MFLENNINAFITDDTTEFANSILEVYTNKEIWKKLSDNSEKSLFPFSIEKLKLTIKEIETIL